MMQSSFSGTKARRTNPRSSNSTWPHACIEALERRRLLVGSHFHISFDELTPGEFVTNQYSDAVTFSSPGDANEVEAKSDVGTTGEGSEPNEIGGPGGSTADLFLAFKQPVLNVQFLVTGVDDVGTIGQIKVLLSDGTEVDSTIDSVGRTPTQVNLSFLNKSVTTVEILDVTDTLGVGYDDFEFDVVNSIKGKVTDTEGNPIHGVKFTVPGITQAYFSDHDNIATDVDDALDGDFEIFGVSRTTATTVTATAMSIDGTTFTKQFTIQPSQFSHGIANVGTFQMDNFPVITSDGSIVLLQDILNSSRSHIIRRRSGTATTGFDFMLQNSARYKSEVRAVMGRLASFGFRQNDGTGTGEDAPPLTVIDTWTTLGSNFPNAEFALLLFQDLWFHHGSSRIYSNARLNGDRSILNGQVDKTTLLALNTPGNVVLWAKNDESLKKGLPNFFTYQAGDSHRWFHASAAKLLHDLTDSVKPDGISALTLNSDSGATGLRLPEGGHAAGSEVDMSWVTTAGTAGAGNFFRPLKDGLGREVPVATGTEGEPLIKTADGVQREWTDDDRAGALKTEEKAIAAGRTWRTIENYSRGATHGLILRILSMPETIEQVIFNDPDLHAADNPLFISDKRFQTLSPHNNHIHVGVQFSRDTLSAQTSGAPAWPPVAFKNRSITTPINEGDSAVLRGSIVDADPRDVFFLDVTWGDGTPKQTYRFEPGDPRQVAIPHRYRDNGDFTVSLRWHGQQPGGNSATLSVHVNNVAPIVHAGANATLNPSGWLRRSGTFTDPGADTWSATVDYGDGSGPQKLELARDGSFNLRHKYRHDGEFVVIIRIIDDDGGVGTARFTVTTGNHTHKKK
jgi:PKD domain